MPTTSYTDSTFAVNAIGGRTDSAGEEVSDYTAEEARFLAQILSAGYLKPTASFQVAAQTIPNMTVKVGSGSAKADYYVVDGGVGGQGTYVVRLDAAGQSVTVPAADASQPRVDEIYLVVRDDTYDAGGLGLPRLGYRKGDLGGTGAGPDASWEAYALLGSISVPALATSITNTNIVDERVPARLLQSILSIDVDAKGDLIVGTADNVTTRLAVGTNGQILTADSAQAAGVKWAAPPVSGFTNIVVQMFTFSGTWTKPAGASKVLVELVGAGGGGRGGSNSGGGGGGAGGYAAKLFAASALNATESVTVGAAGEEGTTASATSEDGGASIFKTVTAGGGEGGDPTANGGLGGTCSGGDVNLRGGSGGHAYDWLGDPAGGQGGASYFGTGEVVGAPGAGGGGGDDNDTGWTGEDGVVIVTTYIIG